MREIIMLAHIWRLRVIEWDNLPGKDDGDDRQADHNAYSEVKRRAGDVPGCLFILFPEHIFAEDGDKGRSECASCYHVKDQIGDHECLEIGVGGRTGSKDKGEH